MGDSALRMPLTELSLFVIERAKRNAGIALLKSPTNSSVIYFSLGTNLMAPTATGKAQRPEIPIRKQVNSTGVKAINPFLIRIYEVPQINVSKPSSNQF